LKLKKPNTPPSEMSTEALLSAIEGIRELAVDVVEYLSEVLAELRKRGEKHPFFNDRILRFWLEINDQELSAEAAIGLANRPMIKAILPLPHADQIAIAHGRDVAVATLNNSGDIKSDDMPIHRMDGPTLKRAFGPDGIRSVHDQGEMIKAAGRVQRHGMFTWDEQSGRVRVGNQTFTWEDADIKAVARRAGYSIVLTRSLGDVEDLAG
jgi:hypothetical protein